MISCGPQVSWRISSYLASHCWALHQLCLRTVFRSIHTQGPDLNYRETQQFAPGLEWAPCTPRVLSKPPLGENCTQRDELPNICYTGSVTALPNRDGIKEQNHVEADPSADRERRTWRRRDSQRAENCLLVLYS